MKKILVALLVAVAVALSGCAATGVAISKHELDVQTTMTDSIFLDPPMPGHNKILVQVRNTSDKSDFAIEPQLKDDLRQRGWTITDNPAEADYMLQANVLKAEKMSKTAAKQMFGSSYGGSLGAGALGAAASYAGHGPGNGRTDLAVGLLAAGAEFISGQLVKDVYYTVITDIQISQRVDGTVKKSETQNLSQGSSGTEKVEYAEETHWKKYRTRVVSVANKVNLDWDEAKSELVTGLSKSIAGLF